LQAHVKEVNKQKTQVRQIDERTIDKVFVGDPASETAHRLEGESDSVTGCGNRGLAMRLTWR
jgi:hypothetical protein